MTGTLVDHPHGTIETYVALARRIDATAKLPDSLLRSIVLEPRSLLSAR